MDHIYRENPMRHIAALTSEEVEQACREFVQDRSAEDFEVSEVQLKVTLRDEAGTYDVTAEVIGQDKVV